MAPVSTVDIWGRACSMNPHVRNKTFCSRAWCCGPSFFFFMFRNVWGKATQWGWGLCRLNVQHRVKHCFPISRRYTLRGLSAGVRHWPQVPIWYDWAARPTAQRGTLLWLVERGKMVFAAIVCCWNLLDGDKQCLVLLSPSIFWHSNNLCYWPTFGVAVASLFPCPSVPLWRTLVWGLLHSHSHKRRLVVV